MFSIGPRRAEDTCYRCPAVSPYAARLEPYADCCDVGISFTPKPSEPEKNVSFAGIGRVRARMCVPPSVADDVRESRALAIEQIRASDLQHVDIDVDNGVRCIRIIRAEIECLGYLLRIKDLPLSVGVVAPVEDQAETRRVFQLVFDGLHARQLRGLERAAEACPHEWV